MKRKEIWPVKKFYNVPSNPIQRDTKLHAKKALRTHLGRQGMTQDEVSIAELPDGSRFVLDGHTRRYLWQKGQLHVPEKIYVTIYKVANRDEMTLLYYEYDNTTAQESNADKLYGAFNEQGFFPTSAIMQRSWVTAMGLIFQQERRTQPDYVLRIVKRLLPTLRRIDQQGFAGNDNCSAPVKAALLHVYRTEESPHNIFWRQLFADEGNKEGKRRDAVQQASEKISEIGIKVGYTGSSFITHVVLTCYEKYKQDPGALLKPIRLKTKVILRVAPLRLTEDF